MLSLDEIMSEALQAYDFEGEITEAAPFGEGHINRTYCICVKNGDKCTHYILQAISTAAFKNPDQLMHNIMLVTDYLREEIAKNGGNPERETLSLLKTRTNAPYFTASDGSVWRIYLFVEDTICLQKAETPELFYASAKAFGRFQRLLDHFPADTLYETIERFHDTENRYDNLMRAVAEDKMGRAAGCSAEIDFARARKEDCSVAMNALREGKLPLRVTHNDTKLNNVLMDKETGEGICVIDLDTVMPGLSINDFGDSIRFGANHNEEDEPDQSKVHFDLPLFETYTQGFLEGTGGILTQTELEYLPWGAKLMTLECGMRFLTDFLEGDVYFKISRPNQNLDRARTQFKLVSDMEQCWDEMAETVSRVEAAVKEKG